MIDSTKSGTVVFYAKVTDLDKLRNKVGLEYLIMPVSTQYEPLTELMTKLPEPKQCIKTKFANGHSFYYESFPVSEKELLMFASMYKDNGYRLVWSGEGKAEEIQNMVNSYFKEFIDQQPQKRKLIKSKMI